MPIGRNGDSVDGLPPVPGVEIAGLLPRDMQHYTVYTAGVATASRNAEAAKALVALLMTREATPAIEAAGMERVGP